jgi:hypothetical protein
MEMRKKAATRGELKAEALKSDSQEENLEEKKSSTKASTKPLIGRMQSKSFCLDFESMEKICGQELKGLLG